MSLSRRAFTTVTLAFAGTRARAGGGEVQRVRLGDDGERTRLVLDVARISLKKRIADVDPSRSVCIPPPWIGTIQLSALLSLQQF